MNTPTNSPNGRVDYASFMALIERSSLGTPGARELRRRTTTSDALRVMASADENFRQVHDAQPWLGLVGYQRHQVCLTAAATGNRAALDTLVTDLNPLVWHVARGQGLNRQAAEEVAVSVWLKLLHDLDTVDTARRLAAWLIVTTRRKAAQFQREHPDSWFDDEILEPLASQEQSERDRRMWAAFRRLPLRCQELLRLTVLARRVEYMVVAEALHMPLGAIGPTRGRCLSKLRELLERDTEQVEQPTMSEPPTLFLALGEAIDEADPIPVRLLLCPTSRIK